MHIFELCKSLNLSHFCSTLLVMELKRNIYLIGPRACGKTSIGRALATSLGVDFIDTDHALVENVGMEISDYIDANGWDGFRDKESDILSSVSSSSPKVVGCGGGIVLREQNRSLLRSGTVIYLKASVDTLVQRLMADPNEAQRPSLTGKPLDEEVREILAERAPLYEGCADIILPEGEIDEIVQYAMYKLDNIS